MSEQDFRLLRIAGFAAAFLAAWALQALSPHSRQRGSGRVNAGLWLIDAAVTGAVCGACVCRAAIWAEGARFGLLHWLAAPTAIAVPVSVACLDLVSYAWHRANHLVPFLWRWHQVHHSDRTFTVSTALRFHPGELVLSLPSRLLAVLLLGAPLEAVVFFEVAFTLANAVEHGDIDLPAPLERVVANVFVTPALHRWHHTIVAADRDTNYGTIFSVWDRWMGTYTASWSRTVVSTGLPGVEDVSLRSVLLLPLRARATAAD